MYQQVCYLGLVLSPAGCGQISQDLASPGVGAVVQTGTGTNCEWVGVQSPSPRSWQELGSSSWFPGLWSWAHRHLPLQGRQEQKGP